MLSSSAGRELWCILVPINSWSRVAELILQNRDDFVLYHNLLSETTFVIPKEIRKRHSTVRQKTVMSCSDWLKHCIAMSR